MQTPRTVLVIANSDVRDPGSGPKHVTLDPQLRSMLQWLAASMADIPQIQLSPDRELQQVIVAIFLKPQTKATRAFVLPDQLICCCSGQV